MELLINLRDFKSSKRVRLFALVCVLVLVCGFRRLYVQVCMYVFVLVCMCVCVVRVFVCLSKD